MRGGELGGVRLGRLRGDALGLGGGLLDLGDSALGVCRGLLGVGEFRSRCGERLLKLKGLAGGLLGLCRQPGFELARAGNGLVMLGME